MCFYPFIRLYFLKNLDSGNAESSEKTLWIKAFEKQK